MTETTSIKPYKVEVVKQYSLNISKSNTDYLKYQKLLPYTSEDVYLEGAVKVRYFNDVFIDLDNGIALNKDFKIIQESKKYPTMKVGTYLSKIDKHDVNDQEFVTIINGALNAQYFHIWFDSLLKLYYLNKIQNNKPSILIWNKVPKIYKDVIYCFKEFFKIIETDTRFVKVNNYVIIKPIYWAKHAPYFSTSIRDFFIQNLLVDKHIKIETPEYIYIKRKSRSIVNSEEIEDVFKKFGFTCLFLEDFTIFEQAHLFNKSKIIAGLHGAGLTNLIFANSNLKVIELQNFAVVPTYYFIAQQLGLEYHYLFPNESNFNDICDPYTENKKFHQQKLKDVSFNVDCVKELLSNLL